MTRVLIADDHPIMLSGIEAILKDSPFEVVARAVDGKEVLDALPTSRPDILLLDVAMPKMSGMDVLRTIRTRGDERRVVLLTASLADHALVEAIKLGVDGIMLKEGAEHLLVRCLEQVVRGERWIDKPALERALNFTLSDEPRSTFSGLTPRERAVAGLVAQGMRNKAIANELGVTEGTVKVYLHRIYEKLGVESRTELAIMAREAEGA